MLVLSFPRYVSLCIPLCLSLCDSLCVPLSVSRFFVHGSTSFVVLSCFVCIESCATTMAGFSQYLPRLSCARVAAACHGSAPRVLCSQMGLHCPRLAIAAKLTFKQAAIDRSGASLRAGGIRFAVNSVRCSPCVSGTTGKNKLEKYVHWKMQSVDEQQAWFFGKDTHTEETMRT